VGARHRWLKVHNFRDVCRHCGEVRDRYFINRRTLFLYQRHDRNATRLIRACDRQWPVGWARDLRHLVEAKESP